MVPRPDFCFWRGKVFCLFTNRAESPSFDRGGNQIAVIIERVQLCCGGPAGKMIGIEFNYDGNRSRGKKQERQERGYGNSRGSAQSLHESGDLKRITFF